MKNSTKTLTGTTIGTTHGLATSEFNGKGCEQAYVKETEDEQRPLRLEFWEGYAVPNHAILTRNQAVELALIILKWAAGYKTGKISGTGGTGGTVI